MTNEIELRRPDDWHVHLRDGALLAAVLPATAEVYGRALVMPNLDPPVTTAALARAYRERIAEVLGPESRFTPLMTCYLTDQTDPDDLQSGHATGDFHAAKLYPAGATYRSERGVTAIGNIHPVLERMQRIDMPLCVHGEVTDPDVDVFDREAVFIDRVLQPLRRDFPELRIVFEHITTGEAVDFVLAQPRCLGATITPHHLLLNRNALFTGGIRPHHYCLPVVKRERHRQRLRAAATSGDPRFFLGTDSAPHLVAAKETACGCAGIYSAPVALACYAQVFAEENALARLSAFAALNGAAFHGLPANADTIRLRRREQPLRHLDRLPLAAGAIEVFLPEQGLWWELVPNADLSAGMSAGKAYN